MSKNLKKRTSPLRGMLPHLPDETMVPDRMRIRTSGHKEMARHAYTRDHATVDFRNGFPIGNGDMGCIVHGAPTSMHFIIGKNDLWWDDYEAPTPVYLPGGIADVRARAEAGEVSLRMDEMKAYGNRSNKQIQTTAAHLNLHLTEGGIPANYSETMEMVFSGVRTQYWSGSNNGLASGSFSTYTAINRSEGVMIAHAIATGAPTLGNFRFELSRPQMSLEPDCAALMSEEEIAANQEEIDTYYSPEPFVDGAFAGFTMRLRTGTDPLNSPDFRYVVMLTETDAQTSYYKAGHTLVAEGRAKKDVRILLTVVTTRDAKDPYAEAKRRLEDSIARGKMVWGIAREEGLKYWDRSWIRMPKDEMSRIWYWGLYEAYNARCPGKMAPGYLAPWFNSAYANWGFHILTYEQTKTNLGLLATNHAELLEPWFRLCRTAQEPLKKFTRNFYGMNGTCYPHAISGSGQVVSSVVYLNNTIMNISTTGETVKYCWDYYDFTGDVEFLREIGYPILREAAIFYSEYLQTDEETGQKYIFPSRSQEFTSSPITNFEYMTDSIVDVAIFKYILRRSAQAARILGVDEALAERWESDADQMRKEYATWPNGVWRASADWDDPIVDYGIKSVTDLTPVSITDEVDAWRGSPEMREAARRTVEKLVPAGRLPWDMSFGILARLRFGDKQYAKYTLEQIPLCREGGNMERRDACDFVESSVLPRDGQHDFFVDKGSAYLAETVTEMLLQSQGGIIRLFPAYPEDIGDAAFFALRARGAFLVSGEFRDGNIAYGIIRSLRGNDCTVANPFGTDAVIRCLENNEEVAFTTDGDNLTFATLPEYEYVIEHRSHPLESFEMRD